MEKCEYFQYFSIKRSVVIVSESIFGICLYCISRSENCVFLEFRVAVVFAIGLE